MDKRKKKPFNETATGKILEKAGVLVPELIKMVGGPITDGVVDAIIGKTEEAAKADPENIELQKLLHEVKMAELAMRGDAQQQAHLERMKEMELSTQESLAAIADVQNARSREIEFMKQSGGKRDWLMGGIMLVWTLLVVFLVVVLMFVEVPEKNQRLADMAFGFVLPCGAGVLYYFTGTTAGSKLKNNFLFGKK